jgi:hypothetical protein
LVESTAVASLTKVYVLQLSSETNWSSRTLFFSVHVIILRNFT